MSNIPVQNTIIVSSPGDWRFKTDEEIEEMTFRPWICGCGDVVDDNKPRRCAWLYRPCCRNVRLDKEDNADTTKDEETNQIIENEPSSNV